MFEFVKTLFLNPRCPKCGHRPLKRQRRTGPVPAGRDPLHVWGCPKCGEKFDLPLHLFMRMCQ